MQFVELRPEHGYVVGAAVASWAVHHLYMSIGIAQARKKYGVDFPTLYATEKECKDEKQRRTYNCVQRGHQNSLENQPIFLTLLLLSGLKYPVTSSVAGAVYLAGRVMYFNGYSSGEPKKRMLGAFSYFGLFTLVGCCCRFAYTLLANK